MTCGSNSPTVDNPCPIRKELKIRDVITSPDFIEGQRWNGEGNIDIGLSVEGIDGCARDESRGTAKFVVEQIGHPILARRLNPDDTYNPDGELIEFTADGYDVKQLKIVGRMELVFKLTENK